MDYKLPIYTSIKEIKEERKKQYLETLNKLYPNMPTLTVEDYKRLKDELNNGNKNALVELVNKSIFKIMDITAKIYAKYDIEKYLPIEEAVSHAIFQLNATLECKYNKLPLLLSEYFSSTLNLLVFRKIAREYNKEALHFTHEEIMDNGMLAWEIDQEQNETIADAVLMKQGFEKALKKATTQLTQKEKDIITMRYGLETGMEMSCVEIGEQLGLTRARIHGILKSALIKLRRPEKAKYIKIFNTVDMGN